MSFSHFITTSSPQEGQSLVHSNGVVTFTFKARSNGRRHTHMYRFHVTAERSFSITRGEMIEAHAALQMTLDALWTACATISGAITAKDNGKATPAPLLDHQRHLADVTDIASDRLTTLRNGLSFLDECEKLSIVPTLWVSCPSLQTIFPLARSAQSWGPIAMCRRPLDIVYNMKGPNADPQLNKAAALVAKTQELCAKFPSPPLVRSGAIRRDTRNESTSGSEAADLHSEPKSSETTRAEYYEDDRNTVKATPTVEPKHLSAGASSYLTANDGLCTHCGHSPHCTPTSASSGMSNHSGTLGATPHVTKAAPVPVAEAVPAPGTRAASAPVRDSRDSFTNTVKPVKPHRTSQPASLASRGERSRSLEVYDRNTSTSIDYTRRASEGGDTPGAIANVPPCPNHETRPLPETYDPPRSEGSRTARTPITSRRPRSSATSEARYVNGNTRTANSTNTSERTHNSTVAERNNKSHAAERNRTSRASMNTDKSYPPERRMSTEERSRAAYVSAKSDINNTTASSRNSYNTAALYRGNGIHTTPVWEKRKAKEVTKSSDSASLSATTKVPKGSDASRASAKYYTPPSSGSSNSEVHSEASSGSSITESTNSDPSTFASASLRTHATSSSKHTQSNLDPKRNQANQVSKSTTATRIAEKGPLKAPSAMSGTTDRSYHTAPDFVGSFVPQEDTHTLGPASHRRISHALKDSRPTKTSPSGSTSPYSDGSYITAPTPAPGFRRGVVTETIEKDSQLIAEIQQILGDRPSTSSTVRAVVSDNRLDSKDNGLAIAYNVPCAPVERSDSVCAVVSYNASPRTTPKAVARSYRSVSNSSSSSTARPTSTMGSTGSSTARAPSSRLPTSSSTAGPPSAASVSTTHGPASFVSSNTVCPPSTVSSGFSFVPSTMSASTAYPPSTVSSGATRPTKSSSTSGPPSIMTSSTAYPPSTVTSGAPRSTKSSSTFTPPLTRSSSASSSSTVVPDTLWWKLPKKAVPLSECDSPVSSVAGIYRGKRGAIPWSNSNSSGSSDSDASILRWSSDVSSSTVSLRSTATSRNDPGVVLATSPGTKSTKNGAVTGIPPLSSARSKTSDASVTSVASTLRRR